MKNRKALVALVAMMAMAFFAVGSLSAQTPPATETIETEETIAEDLDLEDLNPENEADLQILLTTLGEHYEVDLVILTGLIDEGYGVQEIWLALEIQRATGTTLEESLIAADGVNGHGWGVLAHALGIKPGSAEFLELKGKIVMGNKAMLGELKTEREERGFGKPDREPAAPKGDGGKGKGKS